MELPQPKHTQPAGHRLLLMKERQRQQLVLLWHTPHNLQNITAVEAKNVAHSLPVRRVARRAKANTASRHQATPEEVEDHFEEAAADKH